MKNQDVITNLFVLRKSASSNKNLQVLVKKQKTSRRIGIIAEL